MSRKSECVCVRVCVLEKEKLEHNKIIKCFPKSLAKDNCNVPHMAQCIANAVLHLLLQDL